MRTIHKYPLEVTSCVIDIPVDSRVICVHEQRVNSGLVVPTLWIEVDIDEVNKEAIQFVVIGTGQEIPKDFSYVGTCFIGYYVWHVYRSQ